MTVERFAKAGLADVGGVRMSSGGEREESSSSFFEAMREFVRETVVHQRGEVYNVQRMKGP